MITASTRDLANHHASKASAFKKTFAGQLKKIEDCKTKAHHTPAFDRHYNHTFCSTCETQLD